MSIKYYICKLKRRHEILIGVFALSAAGIIYSGMPGTGSQHNSGQDMKKTVREKLRNGHFAVALI